MSITSMMKRSAMPPVAAAAEETRATAQVQDQEDAHLSLPHKKGRGGSVCAFPLATIKSYLQRNDGVGIVTKPSLELVSAASAALITSLVEAAARHKKDRVGKEGQGDVNDEGSNAAAGNELDKTPVLITLDDLRVVVRSDKRFRMLADALESPNAVAALQAEDDSAPVRRRRQHRKRMRQAVGRPRQDLDVAMGSDRCRLKDPPSVPAAVGAGYGVELEKTGTAALKMEDGDNSYLRAVGDAATHPARDDVTRERKRTIEVDEEDYDD